VRAASRPEGPVKPPPDLDPADAAPEDRYQGYRDNPAVRDQQEALLTDENQASMEAYGATEGGRGISDALRAENLTDDQRAEVAKLDDTFHMTHTENQTIYRGVHAASDEDLFVRLEVLTPGDVIYDRGYQSASPDLCVAKNYSNEDHEPVRVIFEIEVPAGTRVAYLDNYNEHQEVEDLLPRDSLLEYLGQEERKDGYVYVRFEYTQEGFEYTERIPGEGRGAVSTEERAGGPVGQPPDMEWPPGSDR
jgi:ADP-ribosyltransferase exoenzyme